MGFVAAEGDHEVGVITQFLVVLINCFVEEGFKAILFSLDVHHEHLVENLKG